MNHWTISIFLNLFILSFLFLSAIQASEFFGVPTWILVAACQSRHVVRRGHNLTVAGAVPGPWVKLLVGFDQHVTWDYEPIS